MVRATRERKKHNGSKNRTTKVIIKRMCPTCTHGLWACCIRVITQQMCPRKHRNEQGQTGKNHG